jgi:hypothetical protein
MNRSGKLSVILIATSDVLNVELDNMRAEVLQCDCVVMIYWLRLESALHLTLCAGVRFITVEVSDT